MSEAVYVQHLMGIDGVIVDLVSDITKAVMNMVKPLSLDVGDEGDERVKVEGSRPQFSQRELEFLLKLIPELIQQ